MAVTANKSGPITNRDADPRVKNQAHVVDGHARSSVGTMETANDDSIGSTYRFFSVPSNSRIEQLLLYSDDSGTTGDMDIGIYQTTDNGGAVVDADFFASAVDINAAALSAVDVTHESAVFGLEDAEKPLWSALGLTSDPGIDYDVVGTLTEAVDAIATLTLKGRYVI